MKPKKVLIIAHFFYPCNVIAAHRPKSWASELSKAGYEVTVLTRNWDGTEKNWDHYLADSKGVENTKKLDGFEVVYIPYRRTNLYRLSSTFLFKKFKLLRFCIEVFSSMIGALDFDRNIFSNYRTPATKLMNEKKFDLIIATSGPYTSLKLASHLSKQFNIPWIADFRDVWSMELLKTNNNAISLKSKIRIIGHQYFLAKWLKNSSLAVLCSEGFAEIFEKICPEKKILYIKNGYEKNLYNGIIPKINKSFTILCLGTLYMEQDRQILYQGVKLFLKANPNADFCVNFLGVNVNPLVSNEIKENIDSKHVLTTDFVDRKQALEETLGAQILYYPVWKGYKGIYSGKIFEYLGAKRNVLITPGDGFVLDQLLKETNAGIAANTDVECFDFLQTAYHDWKINGTVNYHGNTEAIEKYTRENQAEILIKYIQELIG